jgi:hypothetical protein
MVVKIQVLAWDGHKIPVQSMPITTKVERSNPVHGEVYLIQQYVIKFVSYLRQVGGFLRVHRFQMYKNRCGKLLYVLYICTHHEEVSVYSSMFYGIYHHQSCEFEPRSWRGVLDTTLYHKVCQWLTTGQWYSLGTPVSSTNTLLKDWYASNNNKA